MNTININLRGLNVISVIESECFANKCVRVAIDGVTESQLPKELVKAATIIDRRIGQSFCSPQVSLTFVVDCDKSNPYNSDVVKNLTAARDFANQLSILAAK